MNYHTMTNLNGTVSQSEIDAVREENMRLKERVAELEAALDSEHASVGHNIWRFWSDKAREYADKLKSAREENARLAARVAELEAAAMSDTPALKAADELATDLMITADNAADAAKTDPRWEGVAEKLRARLAAYRIARKDAP